jgi:hypothetical protein
MNTIQKLDQLAEYEAQRAYLELKRKELIDTVLTPEIRARLDEIDAEFFPQFEAVDEKTITLTSEIKTDVIQSGASVKGANLQAVFSKGRISWDTKALDGYAAAHPEIAPFRKEGAPSVSIRKA